MIDLIFLLRNSIYIKMPAGVVGWLGWLAMLGLVFFIILRGWHYHASWTRRSWIIFLVFVFLVPITSLLIPGLRITGQSNLPPPLFMSEPDNLPIMFLATLPWFLAAGLLGPAPAAGLAALSGLLLALWSTHNLFLPVELALLAAILSI